MAPGCDEKLDFKFLGWVWSFRSDSRPRIVERLERFGASNRLIRLRNPKEVTNFLSEVQWEKQWATRRP